LIHGRDHTTSPVNMCCVVTSLRDLAGLQTALSITWRTLRYRSHVLGRLFMVTRIHSLAAEHTCAMCLPHLVTKGVLFLTLFGRQDCVEIALGFDLHETQLALERFALFDLGFDDGQLRLLIRHERPEFPIRHLNICLSTNLCAVLVKSEGLQLGDL